MKRSIYYSNTYLFLGRTLQALLPESQFGTLRFREVPLTLEFRGFGPATRSRIYAVKVLSGGGSGNTTDVSRHSTQDAIS